MDIKNEEFYNNTICIETGIRIFGIKIIGVKNQDAGIVLVSEHNLESISPDSINLGS